MIEEVKLSDVKVEVKEET